MKSTGNWFPTLPGALCAEVDPETFFPKTGGSTVPAKQVCARCCVRAECLEWVLEHPQRYGVWGGKSETERRRLAAARALREAG